MYQPGVRSGAICFWSGDAVTLSIEQRLQRLEVRLGEVGHWRVRAAAPLGAWRFDGEPIEMRQPWPALDGLHVISHPEIEIPGSWSLEETFLDLDMGGESLLHIGYPDDSYEVFGVDVNHSRFPLRQRRFSLDVAAVARFPFGTPNRDPRLSVARLIWLDPAVDGLHRRLRMVIEAARALESDDVVQPLLRSAERALAALEWPTATEAYLNRIGVSAQMLSLWALPPSLDVDAAPPLTEGERERVSAVAGELEDRLERLRERYPGRGAVALVGHAHIDLAWLWPLDETVRKARRTFATAVALLDRYPEFRFTQSSAQLYELVESEDPKLFERVREQVAAGGWEPIGGMWVEPDANMPSGESLVRQLLLGQRYFAEKFGFTHDVCWMPDCFGFTPALPQLLLGAGIRNFFTIKLTWSETNRFPYDVFWWEGLDGSRVLAHLFDNPIGAFAEGERVGTFDLDGRGVLYSFAGLGASTLGGWLGGYNGDTGPLAVLATWRNYRGKHVSPETLLSIGWGDGGGGPTAEMIEQTRELATLPAMPETRFTRVADFYDQMRRNAEASTIPTWSGELYLEFHRGTLTTQGRVKRLHRRAEHDLVAAEVLASLDALLEGEAPASLAPEWKVLLRNEFHDILPGSSIREVYERAETELEEVIAAAQRAIDRRLDVLVERLVPAGDAEGLFVVNPHLSSQPLRVELEDGSAVAGSDELAGLEARVIIEPNLPDPVHASENELENALVRVVLGDDGTLASVYDKQADREVLDDRGNQLWVYADKPRLFDAWDIDPDYAETGQEIAPPESLAVVERGPHRGAIRMEWRHAGSRIRQDVRLWANSPRVEFRTTLDWHDRRLLLKARFPLAVRSARASFETAFGVVERPTHRNTSWDAARFEVAAHRFADLSEPGYGVALLNDGRYGHHALGSELGISLLRSPAYPDPLADEGEQTVTYALYPHRGRWLEGGVLREAQDLNRPLLARRVRAKGPASWRPLRLEGLPLGLGTLKALEDGGGLVLRTYEPQGARGRIEASVAPGWTMDAELNLLEEELGPPDLEFTPFRVHSWRVRRSNEARRS
jgi:alpha-mannosidase